MTKRVLLALAAVPVAFATLAAPAAAQLGGRISLEPYVGYGFFGTLPGGDAPGLGQDVTLEAGVAYGGRAAFQISDQFALFGNFQRSEPKLDTFTETELTVDHWSAGVEFYYVPRGGAEGMLPLILEAGLGQARYDWSNVIGSAENVNDFAVNLGVSSALRFSNNFAIRYGAYDYISNYGGDSGIVNQIFARVGAELRF